MPKESWTMKQILKKAFEEHGFHQIDAPFLKDNPDDFFAANTDENRTSFYLVLFREKNIESNFLETKISDYYEGIKRLDEQYDIQMDKNLSMLICLKASDTLGNADKDKDILHIEEDPIYFKKYVLTYTDKEVNKLKSSFNKESVTKGTFKVSSLLNLIINDDDEFNKFKKSPSTPSLFNLASKLMIKLPFIVLDRRMAMLENLSHLIETNLVEQGLFEITNQFLDAVDTSKDESEIISQILSYTAGEKE